MQAIGVLTLAHTQNDNYGAHLQAWALITALRKEVAARPAASEPIAVGLVPTQPLECYLGGRSHSNRAMSQPTGDLDADKKRALEAFKIMMTRQRGFEHFCRSMVLRVPRATVGNVTDQKSSVEHGLNMKYVVGSDWVWCFANGFELKPEFFGFLAPSSVSRGGVACRYYAYAASFGTSLPSDPAFARYRDFMVKGWQQFRLISLREPTWLDTLQNSCHLSPSLGPVTTALDPSFLLDRADYHVMTAEHMVKNEPYILYYSFSTFYGTQEDDVIAALELIARYREQTHQPNLAVLDISPCETVSTPRIAQTMQRLHLRWQSRFVTAPHEFVNFVAHAQLVLTNSFHGAVFSLIFNTPFSYFYRNGCDPRLAMLQDVFGIKDVLLSELQGKSSEELKERNRELAAAYNSGIAALREPSLQLLRQVVED